MFEGLHEEILKARTYRDLTELPMAIQQAAFDREHLLEYEFSSKLTNDQIESLVNEHVEVSLQSQSDSGYKYRFTF